MSVSTKVNTSHDQVPAPYSSAAVQFTGLVPARLSPLLGCGGASLPGWTPLTGLRGMLDPKPTYGQMETATMTSVEQLRRRGSWAQCLKTGELTIIYKDNLTVLMAVIPSK